MAIEKPAFYSVDAENAAQVIVQMLTVRPVTLQLLPDPVEGNRLVGYYNTSKRVVELFVSAPDGTFWMRVTG